MADPRDTSQRSSDTARPGQNAPAYVFLASDADSSFISGIVLAEMGGKTTAG